MNLTLRRLSLFSLGLLAFAQLACESTLSEKGGGSANSPASGLSGAESCDIYALLETKCADCHGTDLSYGDLDFVSPGVDARMSDVASISCPDCIVVVPGSPEQSLLYQKVASTNPPCGKKMPIDGSLSPEEVACIRQYIIDLSDVPVEQCETCGSALSALDFQVRQ